MSGPRLSFATSRRYETKFLLDGIVKVKDFDITYHDTGAAPFPVFRDLVTNVSYDIGELAFSHYLIAKDMGKPLTAIPAFPSRFFPHLGAIVRKEITQPWDLVGKRIGVMGFGYNPAVWLRGTLLHEHDVPVDRIIWVEDAADDMFRGLDYPRSRRFTVEKLAGLTPQLITAGGNLRPPESIENGLLDGVCAPAWGLPLSAKTRKLFEDPVEEARRYCQATGVFPINTVVLIKEPVAKQYPTLADRLMEALTEARHRYHQEFLSGQTTEHMGFSFDFLKGLGIFPDRYGLAPNLAAVRMAVQYCYEQGLIKRLYSPEDLFLVS